MNIETLRALIPASFEYKYVDAADQEQSETITLGLKRMAFSTATSKAFRNSIDESDTDAIAEMLAKLIGEWNMDANGEPFPPTVENINACPADFIAQVAECAFKKLFPDPKKASDSLNGSAPEASSTADSTNNSESDTPLAEPAVSGA